MHLADNVWTTVERHLFADSSGRRHGRPRVGRWFDFTRIPGRAKSHTIDRKWETFRLHGTLEGHRQAYDHNGRFQQPRVMRTVDKSTRSWWDHDGPLAVVLTGLGVGDVVLPVRLPTAPCNQAHLEDPSKWHKVDLVRSPDPTQPGGWRYEAHLLVLTAPYVSPAVETARAAVPTNRRAGADLNVSNLTIASVDGTGGDVKVTRVARDDNDRQSEVRRRKKQRDRQRALDRSRRNQNPDQYRLSDAQRREQQRRRDAGLPEKQYTPAGPRKARADGKPRSAYRRDRLSHSYRQTRRKMAAAEQSRRQRSKQAAREAAKPIIAEHGALVTIEDINVSHWARRWGRGIAVFTPGRLQAALEAEAEACGGEIRRASTFTTALSQHCLLCGHRSKKPLGQRTHTCPACGLTADRDAMAALLAAHTVFDDPDDPDTAHVEWESARQALHDPDVWNLLEATINHTSNETLGRQDAPSASTHTDPHGRKHAVGVNGPPDSRTAVGSARRTAGPPPPSPGSAQAPDATPQQTPPRAVTSVDSAASNPCTTPDGSANAPPLRDIS